MNDTLLAPSILSADFTELGREIRAVVKAGAEVVHIDVMDGHFVPNITIGPLIVEAARRATDAILDVHLMIEDADAYIDRFAEAGADWLTVHVEACPHLQRTVSRIRELGLKAGAVLNPATPLAALDYILADLDLVMLMSVNPGFGGQSFIPATLDKIRDLAAMLESRGLDLPIEVDGGIGPDTIYEVARAGATIFVSGSAVYGSKPYDRVLAELRREAERGRRDRG